MITWMGGREYMIMCADGWSGELGCGVERKNATVDVGWVSGWASRRGAQFVFRWIGGWVCGGVESWEGEWVGACMGGCVVSVYGADRILQHKYSA